MTTEIVRHESSGLAQVDVASELPAIFTLARALTKASGFLPQHLRNEGEIAAVVLAGRELGIPPMAAIRSIKLIKGNVTLDASMQLALMVRAGCKVRWIADGTAGRAELELTRPGQAPYTSHYSLEDAQKAGLTSNETWKKHPGAMLRARCVTIAGKAYCPDVLSGVYLPDELPGAALEQPQDATPAHDQVTGEVEQSTGDWLVQCIQDVRTLSELAEVRAVANAKKAELSKPDAKRVREELAKAEQRAREASQRADEDMEDARRAAEQEEEAHP